MVHNRGKVETAVASTLAARRRLSCGLGEICPFLTKRPRSNNFMVAPSSRESKLMKKCSGAEEGGCGFRPRGSFTFSKDRCRYLECHRSLQPLQTSSSPSSHCHSGFRSSWPSWHASNQPDAAEAICNAVVNSRVWPSTVARVWVIISARVRGLSRQV